MYLLGTNIILEMLLDRDKADEVEQLIRAAPTLYLSEFSLYSLGIFLTRRQLQAAFLRFLEDMVLGGTVHIVRIPAAKMAEVIRVQERFQSDFDDAYQYAVAEIRNLALVSFDSDFDRTARGRKTPGQVLGELRSSEGEPRA